MHTTWILVADRARARLFVETPGSKALNELQDFVNPQARTPAHDVAQDQPPPRTNERADTQRHMAETHTTMEHRLAERFAHEIGTALEAGRVQHHYDRLVLVASPTFLGTLREVLGKQVQQLVVFELNKDLTTLDASEIRAHLPDKLGA